MHDSWGTSRSDFESLTDYVAALPELTSGSHLTTALQTISTEEIPEPLAGLWYVRAVHQLAMTHGDEGAETLRDLFFPRVKKILQSFISAQNPAGITMDGAGLLVAPSTADTRYPLLKVNALWFAALESTAADLRKLGDRTGDHFERLAGRCRRAFAKMFWSESRGTYTSPSQFEATGDGLDPDSLLLTMLASSPLPGTKQRQLLDAFVSKSLGHFGIITATAEGERVESLIHRAWLARGLVTVMGSEGKEKASSVLLSLRGQQLAATTPGLSAHCKNQSAFHPIGHPDPLTTAHVLAAFR